MNKLLFLFLAYTFIWTALFIFLLSIARKLSLMQKQVKQLKKNMIN